MSASSLSAVQPFSTKLFSDAVRDPDIDMPDGIVGPDRQPSPRRFLVYRNNVASSLVDAMAANFPTIEKLVGEKFFRAMAGYFVRTQPPEVPMLFRYGDKFATFLEGFEPAATLPYLPDVARVEFAWLQAYHAADDAILDPLKLQGVDPDAMVRLVFDTHPATYLLQSDWPVVSIISRNSNDEDCSDIDLKNGEAALITRPAFNVEMRDLPPGGAVFLAALFTGGNLGAAAEAAFAEFDGFDLPGNIGGILEAGVFSGMSVS